MYEYDVHQMTGTGDFVPHAGGLSDFVPRPEGLSDFFPAVPMDGTSAQWDLDAEFEHLFQPTVTEVFTPADVPPPAPPVPPAPPSPPAPPARPMPPVNRRRRRPRLVRLRRSVSLGVVIATITGAVASTISVLGAMVSYGPLRLLASPTAHGLNGMWPMLVYGPWLAGCLTVLHAAAHRRSARTGWIAVVLFSVIAMALCIAHAPRTITASATAGLPPFSALASFLLLSRQIALIRPGQPKVPRQRRRKH